MTLAIVTGGTRGIGKAICLELVRTYDTVIAIYHKDEQSSFLLEKESENIQTKRCNVSSAAEVSKLIREIYEEYGVIHCLVNNAGITQDGYFLMMSKEKWDAVLNINLMGAVNLCKEVLRIMKKEKKGGAIINVSSTSGVTGQIGQTNYSTSKGALIAFSKSLSKEFAKDNITINCVSPGFIETDMTIKLDKERIQKDLIPLGRFGKPEEVAFLVEFLSSNKSRYITGKNFVIDGGMIND